MNLKRNTLRLVIVVIYVYYEVRIFFSFLFLNCFFYLHLKTMILSGNYFFLGFLQS